MRVAMLVTELRPAGAERVVFEIATRLERERFEVRVASLVSRGGDDGAVAGELRAAGIPVFATRMGSRFDALGARRLKRFLGDFRPHVLHAHLFHASLFARVAGRAAGARAVVSSIHVVERRRLRLRRLLEVRTARRDDRTVCVSEAVAAHARAQLGVRDPLVIPNGIDLAHFRELPDRAAARAELGLPDDGSRVIAAVARLHAQKGIDVLVRALARLPEPTPHLVIAGDGERRDELLRLCGELGLADRVRFVGFRPDVRPVLAAADVFCMPSRWEGFGLALIEALAAGLPVVASAVDSLPELVGEAGVLVPPDDPDRLAEALAAITSSAAMCDAAVARAARFDVDRMVAAHARLYLDLAGAGRFDSAVR